MRRLGWFITICVVVAVGCSQASRERLKHFFFEIPDQEEPATPAEESATLARAESKYLSQHPPYGSRQCDACHDSEKRMGVREDLLDACASCHERFFDEDQVGHSPVAEGECRECHVLHRSERFSLLRAPVLDLCAECHDPDDLDEDTHGGAGVEHCTSCHDAHFGESPLLKPGVPGAED